MVAAYQRFLAIFLSLNFQRETSVADDLLHVIRNEITFPCYCMGKVRKCEEDKG